MEDTKKYEEISDRLKAISHPVRLCIVRNLLNRQCNVSKMQECLHLPQSTVSQHLSKLKAAGIIAGERNGLEVCYQVVDPKIRQLVEMLFKNE